MKIRFCEREEKVEESRGRESKEGPTCQRERKVDAPEEHEKSKREPYPLVIQYNQHSYRYVRDLTATFATNQRAENILFPGQSDFILTRFYSKGNVSCSNKLNKCSRTI